MISIRKNSYFSKIRIKIFTTKRKQMHLVHVSSGNMEHRASRSISNFYFSGQRVVA